MSPYSGLFITLEGCEGCGKSTQARSLHKRIHGCSIPVILTQEPGGTPLGDKIRDILKVRRGFNIDAEAELLLFAASRYQLVKDVIRPALQAGKVVVCDRFTDSTVVYQGYGRGVDLDTIRTINAFAAGGLKPDITILLDTPADAGLERKHNSHEDRFEAEGLAFHHAVRDGYLRSAQAEPGRWIVVAAQQPLETVSNLIWQAILPALSKKYPAASG